MPEGIGLKIGVPTMLWNGCLFVQADKLGRQEELNVSCSKWILFYPLWLNPTSAFLMPKE